MGNTGSVFDGVLLGKEATEASATNDHLLLGPKKMCTYTLDIFDDLFEGVWLGPGALPMPPEVKGQDTKSVA